jgi:hypothetical protein
LSFLSPAAASPAKHRQTASKTALRAALMAPF